MCGSKVSEVGLLAAGRGLAGCSGGCAHGRGCTGGVPYPPLQRSGRAALLHSPREPLS